MSKKLPVLKKIASFGLLIDSTIKKRWVLLMGYNLQHSKLMLRKPRRIFRTKHRLFKLFLNLFILLSLLVSIPTHIKRAMAIETVKASALVPEEMRSGSPLSFTQKSPPNAAKSKDPCLPLLSSNSGSKISLANMPGRPNRHNVEKTAAPAALGFILGVRIALGPKDIVKDGNRVQLTSTVLGNQKGGDTHALAIAAYRSCKNEHNLTLKK